MRFVLSIGSGAAAAVTTLLMEDGSELIFESGESLLFDAGAAGNAVDLEFVEPGIDGEYPWLSKVGVLLLAARAGHLDGLGVGEAANMTVELDNAQRQASALIGRPIRARGTVYDDADDVYFAGVVQQIQYGGRLVLTLEA